MRSFPPSIAVGLVLVATGCHLGPNTRTDNPTATQVQKQPPSVDQLIDYLNDNAHRIEGVQSNKVAIDASDHGRSIGLDGQLACQKPRAFRLKANALGKSAADIGSNDQEFWYWISEMKPNYVIHCSYDALKNPAVTQRMAFPFQPEMVLAALGLAEYDKKKSYRVQSYPERSYFELIEQTTSPQGQPLQKVVVFNRETVDPRTGKPQVIAHALRNEKGAFICKALIQSVTVDPTTNAILPRKMTLKWDAEDLQLIMTMGDIRSATFDAQRAGALFQRTQLSNLPSFDLGRGAPDGPGVQQTGATFARP